MIEDISSKSSSLLLEDTKTLLTLAGSANNSSIKTPPRITSQLSQPSPKLSQPSPTINTKEAMNLMQEMWGQGSVVKSAKPFEIFQEEEKSFEQKSEKKFEIFSESQQKTEKKFEIFQENSEKPPPAPKFQIYQENSEVSGQKPKPIIHDENDENQPSTFSR